MIAVTSNLDEVIKSLEAWHKEAVRKMEGMVRKFSYVVTLSAVSHTPLGDAEKYADWYAKRLSPAYYGGLMLKPEEGFARGSWKANIDNDGVITVDSIQQFYGEGSGRQAEDKVKLDVLPYKLGDTVFITNTGPYIGYLEKGYPKGKVDSAILQPTQASIERTYQLHLDDYYKKA